MSSVSQISQPGAAVNNIPNANTNNAIHINNTDSNEGKNDGAPKMDIKLKLKGVSEFNQYPFYKENKKFLFMAGIEAPFFKASDRAPIDLCCVVDESSSMAGDRMKLVKETLKFVVTHLEEEDRFGIIGYHTRSRQVLSLSKMTKNGKNIALDKINQLKPQGYTALCDGLCDGIDMMRKRNLKNSNVVASIMLFTDGQANEGYTQPGDICRAMRDPEYAKKGSQVNNNYSNVSGNNDKDEKNDSKTGGKENENINNEQDLPCTVNTFGFGGKHNSRLLEKIAENGRGMYVFIENKDMIAESFAECLGGLVSIIGKNIELKVTPMNGVKINKCLSNGYEIIKTTNTQENDSNNNNNNNNTIESYTIKIHDIQSEEERDIVFELTLPKLGNKDTNNKKEKWPYMQLNCKYLNIVKQNRNELISNVCLLNRSDNDEIGERNEELDIQYNRIMAANAMENANKLANEGKLDSARKVLKNTSNNIANSKSGQSKYATNLISDMNRCVKNLSNKSQFEKQGSKMLSMNAKAHNMQRSVQSDNWGGQSAYTNSSKIYYKSSFNRKY